MDLLDKTNESSLVDAEWQSIQGSLPSKKLTAIELRNHSWEKNKNIPKWVDINSTDLDQFFTKPSVANECYEKLLKILDAIGVDHRNFTFIEPSAGKGAFYRNLPKNRRLGVDVENFNEEYVKADFLSWEPDQSTHKKYITTGNPPFGYRAWLALEFINHAAKFSEVVAFILPMAFQSQGKGSPQFRVKGMRLIHSEILNQDSFEDENGKTLRVNSLWQVWIRDDNPKVRASKTCHNFVDIFTVDLRKERRCGHEKMSEADIFIQRTFFKHPPKIVTNFNDVKYGCGYGIKIKNENRSKIIQLLESVDWRQFSNLASHNARHISKEHIVAVMANAGFCDVQ